MVNKIVYKKGQVAIFVIIALVVVFLIVALFLIGKKPISIQGGEISFQSAIEKCVRDSVNEAVDKMLPQGGFIEPENYKVYKDNKVSYLCQNLGYYKPCISQHPMLINEEVAEIKNFIQPGIEQCFLTTKSELEKRQYSVSMEPMQLDVSLAPNKVLVNIKRNVVLSRNGQNQNIDNFNIELVNPIYDLSKIAIEIANQQAKYCYFEYVGYMILYPRFGIEVFAMSDSTKIYTITDKQSEKEMNIAIRSCAIPPGI